MPESPAQKSLGGARVQAAATLSLRGAAGALDVEAVTALLAKGADVDDAGDDGRTALACAVYAPIQDGIAPEAHDAAKARVLRLLFARGGHKERVQELVAAMEAFIAAAEGYTVEGGDAAPVGERGGEGVGGSAEAAAAHNAARAEEFKAQLVKLKGKDKKERRMEFVDPAAPQPALTTWLRSLPSLSPDLGYTRAHVKQLYETIAAKVVSREVAGLKAALDDADAPVEEWMVALSLVGGARGFELLLAGALYTADLVDENNKTLWLDDKQILEGSHGVFDMQKIRLPLYFVMNTAMRCAPRDMPVHEVSIYDAAERPPQFHVLRSFAPLIARLHELIETIPSKPASVFRGININISSTYRVGTSVVWNAFTSTSVERGVALWFMSDDANGTFFTILSRDGAAPVEFCSVYKSEEKELLYADNIEFRVMWKLSPTLLRMMHVNFDVVVMQEVGDGGNASPEVGLFKNVLQHALHFATPFLSTYVEGRVGGDAVVPEADATSLSAWLRAWLVPGSSTAARKTPRRRRPQCVVGVGGSGKTSAAIAMVSWMLDPESPLWREGGVSPPANDASTAEAKAGRKQHAAIFPIFIPLPSLRQAVLQPGGLDDYVKASFAVDDAGLQQMHAAYDVVLVADSIDEAGVDAPALRAATSAAQAASLLDMSPWASQCSVILMLREEYLRANNIQVKQLCGGDVDAVHLQPFSNADATRYLRGVLTSRRDAAAARAAKAKAKDPNADVGHLRTPDEDAAFIAQLTAGFGWALENPFLLSLLVDNEGMMGVLSDEAASKDGGMREVDLYEAYLKVQTGKAEGALEVGEAIAAYMLMHNTWEVALGVIEAHVEAVVPAVGDDWARRACLRALPLRVDDWGDSSGAVGFRHRTLAEYLAARRLWRDEASITTVFAARSFTQYAPDVGRLFAQRVRGAPDDYTSRILPIYRGILSNGVGASPDAAAIEGVASGLLANTLALCARSRITLRDLTVAQDAVVPHADLRHLVLEGVQLPGVKFESCWLDGAELHACDTRSCGFSDCNMEASQKTMNHKEDEGVYRVAAFPDGGTLVSCGSDDLIRVWDARTGVQVHTLEMECVDSIAISEDGTTLAGCASYEGTISIWDAASWGLRRTIAADDKVWSIALNRTGTRVLGGSAMSTARVWCTETGDVVQELEGHTGRGISCVDISSGSGGGRMVTGAGDDTVRVWCSDTGTLLRTLEGGSGGWIGLSISADGSRVAACGEANVVVWNTTTGDALLTLPCHSDEPKGVALSRDGLRLATCGADRAVCIHDAVSGKELARFQGHTDISRCVAFTADAAQVISGGDDGAVRLWDVADTGGLQQADGHAGPVSAVAFTPDGRSIISGGEDAALRVWDAGSGLQRAVVAHAHAGAVTGVAVGSPQTRGEGGTSAGVVVSCSADGDIALWTRAGGEDAEAGAGTLLRARVFKKRHVGGVRSVDISADGARVVSGGDDGTVRVWDVATGEQGGCASTQGVDDLKRDRSAVRGVCFTPNGKWVVACEREMVVVWDAASLEEFRRLEHHAVNVTGAAVLPSSRELVSCGEEEVLRKVEISRRGIELEEFHQHEYATGVTAVALAPDGTRLFSAGTDRSLRVWDAHSGKQTQRLEGHASAVLAVAVCPEGHRIATGGADATIRVWAADATNGALKLHAVCGTTRGGPPRFVECAGQTA